jgi:hypothetical protein
MIVVRDFARVTRAAVLASCVVGGVSPALAEQRLIAEVGTWRAIEAMQGGRRYCFVIASPTQRTPLELKRDPASFFVSLRPKATGGGTEISIEFGYPLTPTGNVVSVDAEGFVLVTRNQTAWLTREEDEARLLKAMRAGLDLRVSARSARGNRTTDVYGLRGFSGALAELQKRCRP